MGRGTRVSLAALVMDRQDPLLPLWGLFIWNCIRREQQELSMVKNQSIEASVHIWVGVIITIAKAESLFSEFHMPLVTEHHLVPRRVNLENVKAAKSCVHRTISCWYMRQLVSRPGYKASKKFFSLFQNKQSPNWSASGYKGNQPGCLQHTAGILLRAKLLLRANKWKQSSDGSRWFLSLDGNLPQPSREQMQAPTLVSNSNGPPCYTAFLYL